MTLFRQGQICFILKMTNEPTQVILPQVDKEGANPEKAKQEISEAGLLPEEWGGDTPMVEASISGLKPHHFKFSEGSKVVFHRASASVTLYLQIPSNVCA